MRPVERSAWPKDEDGNELRFKTYKSFFKYLEKAFDNCCSYCEHVGKLDVEHVVPKSHDSTLEVEWSNLLLGCSSCNRDFKKNNNSSRDDYLWPDEVDTFIAFDYLNTGHVKVKAGFPQAREAQAILDLCGLAPEPKNEIKQPNDYLWKLRADIWTVAENELKKYNEGRSTIEDITFIAKPMGHWSIWVTVFQSHREVVEAISEKYRGTHSKYLAER